jgi:ribonuclease HI
MGLAAFPSTGPHFLSSRRLFLARSDGEEEDKLSSSTTNRRVASKRSKRKVKSDKKSKKREFHVFTDGACSGNGKSWARGGIGIHFPKGQYRDISLPFLSPPITNQRAELEAIRKTLEVVIACKLLIGYDEMIIYSDSDYSIKCITIWAPAWKRNGWKRSGVGAGGPLKNLDIIIPISELIAKLDKPIVFVHVRAHTGGSDYWSRGNEVADELATAAVGGARRLTPDSKSGTSSGRGRQRSKGGGSRSRGTAAYPNRRRRATKRASSGSRRGRNKRGGA